MYLTKLVVNSRSREFQRDHADIRQMHRTVMSGFPDFDTEEPARKAASVLWRLDPSGATFVLYVQSAQAPNFYQLPAGYLLQTPQSRSLAPVLDAVAAGRAFAFRLQANPTRSVLPADSGDSKRTRGRVHAIREREEQVRWLQRRGERHGFEIAVVGNSQPDVMVTQRQMLTGSQPGSGGRKIRVLPVRFDGHLMVKDPELFTAAVRDGVGRGKAYGCGMISLAPMRRPEIF